MTRTGFTLAAALAAGLGSYAFAASHTGADCPEDMDTEAGCAMEGAATSESGPVEGAATAPVPPQGDEGEGSTTMDGPDEGAPGDDEAGAGASDDGASGADTGTDAGANTPSGGTDAADAGATGSADATGADPEDAASDATSTDPAGGTTAATVGVGAGSRDGTAGDCPEDMDAEAGCDMPGAEASESGPVEGAATAPVPPEGDGGQGSATMDGPDADADADPEAAAPADAETDDGTDTDADAGPATGPDGGADSGTQAADAAGDATDGMDPAGDPAVAEKAVPEGDVNLAVAYEDGGRYYTDEDVPTFHVAEDGTVDWLTYSGFRRYHSECHVCHGPDGEGSSYAPALKTSVLRMDYYDFYDVVVNGRKHVGAAENSVMPAFGDNENVMCYLDDIYVYLKARGAGEVDRGRPAQKEAKSDMIQDAENACMGT